VRPAGNTPSHRGEVGNRKLASGDAFPCDLYSRTLGGPRWFTLRNYNELRKTRRVQPSRKKLAFLPFLPRRCTRRPPAMLRAAPRATQELTRFRVPRAAAALDDRCPRYSVGGQAPAESGETLHWLATGTIWRFVEVVPGGRQWHPKTVSDGQATHPFQRERPDGRRGHRCLPKWRLSP
jgi:hypothetical protein